jgi:hypothetical protein
VPDEAGPKEAGVSNTGSENPELNQLVRVEELTKPVQSSQKVPSQDQVERPDDHEEGELEWKRPDLKGWDPKPDLVLYKGKKRGLGGKGDISVANIAVDTAVVLHSDDQRKRKAELELCYGNDPAPRGLLCRPTLDQASDPSITVERRRERIQAEKELLQLKFNQELKKWLFPTGCVATDLEVKRFLALREVL